MPAEDTVGGGAEGKREEKTPVYNPGPPSRQEVQPGGIRLPLCYRCGEASAGRERRGERGI